MKTLSKNAIFLFLVSILLLSLLNCSDGSNQKINNPTNSQNNPKIITFEKTFGGTQNDRAISVIKASDEGYMITGYSTIQLSSSRSVGVLLRKTDKNGNLTWEKTFGGLENDFALSAINTSDGGYVFTGSTESFGPNIFSDVYLVKVDGNGNLVWETTFGREKNDRGNSVIELSDGGFLITGSTDSIITNVTGLTDVYLIKTDNSGNLIWEKQFGGAGIEHGNSVVETSDGGYMITGFSARSGRSAEIYVIKTDHGGNLVFEKTLGGVGYDYGSEMIKSSNGNYIIAGYTSSSGAGLSDIYLMEIDNSGNLVWENTIGGTGHDRAESVIETADSGYVLIGYTESSGEGLRDVFIIKVDRSGNLVWEKTFGGANNDFGLSVKETSDGGFVIAGYTESFGAGLYDVYLIKTDSLGNVY